MDPLFQNRITKEQNKTRKKNNKNNIKKKNLKTKKILHQKERVTKKLE